MKFVRIFSDAQGESHLAEVPITLSLSDFAPPAPPINTSNFVPSRRMVFLSVPSGWIGDWHPSPARQYLILLAGELEIEVSDGETRRFVQGDIVRGEDTMGKGHISRSVGKEDLQAAIVQL